MSSNMYWVTTLIFAVIIFLIWIDERNSISKHSKADKAYSVMLAYGVFFCLQDMFWGLCDCDIVKGEYMLFLASSIFHLTIVLTSFYSLRFFISYLEKYLTYTKRYIAISLVTVAAQLILVATNFFYPVLFRIEAGEYVTKTLRPLSFINQYIVFFVSAWITYSCVKKAEQRSKDKMISIFWIAIIPMVTGAFQLYYPGAPFYSLGYFLDCVMLHMFIITKERNALSQESILDAIASSYYSMHLFDLKEDKIEEYIESDIIRQILNERRDGQWCINKVMTASVTDEYLDQMLEFADFSTVSDRLRDTNSISVDFLGRFHGWTRATVMSLERDENGDQKKIMFMTQIIDAQKRKEQEMFANSRTDQLTELLNRRAYESDACLQDMQSENMVYVSIDVNELKVVNDNLGHEAGDELLKGAAHCMRQCFGPYGRVYRMGGDEFSAILFVGDELLKKIQNDFEDVIASWHGQNVDHVSVSCGYVKKKECADMSLDEIANLADTRMYEAKAQFYKTKGVDRRGQAAAHTALCNLYTKILKINLTNDTYAIVNMDVSEQTAEKGFADTISAWLTGFGKSGQVHEEDLESYLQAIDMNHLKKYFRSGKTSISIGYRRRYGDAFKQVAMEMIPADDYTDENQTLFLYVKNIDI